MIDHSDYSCDKCAREFSRHCKNCYFTVDKIPTKFKYKNNIFQKLIKEAQDIDDAINSYKTPEFRKPTPPPPPTSGSNVVKPKKPCTYSTPCGWCTKWDKKCDKKIGGDHTPNQPKADNSLSLKDTRCYFCLTRYVCGEEYEFECQKNDFCHFAPDTETTLEIKR